MGTVRGLLTWAGVAAFAIILGAVGCQSYEMQQVEGRVLQVHNTTVVVRGRPLAPNIMIAVDTSGSMIESVTGTGLACSIDGTTGSEYDPRSTNPCKWNDLKKVLADPVDGFLARSQGFGRFGLLPFPDASSGSCAPGSIVVPVGDDVAPVRDQLLNRLFPGGGTPTSETLMKALEDPALANEEPGRQRFVMLLTDGLPNCNAANAPACQQCRLDTPSCTSPLGCRPTDPPFDSCEPFPFDGAACLDEENLVRAVSHLTSRGIVTFVIGFGRETAVGDANQVLNRAALAGGHPRTGGDTAYYQANSVAQLQTFLEEIMQVFPCTYDLDPKPVDASVVSVSVFDKQDNEETTLTRHVDWDFAGPELAAVRLLGGYCRVIQDAPANRLEIRIKYAEPLD